MQDKESNEQLSTKQQEIIDVTRKFYAAYNTTPSMRALINSIKELYGPDKANSIYLHGLFPGGIAQIIQLAGLPKSTRCL